MTRNDKRREFPIVFSLVENLRRRSAETRIRAPNLERNAIIPKEISEKIPVQKRDGRREERGGGREGGTAEDQRNGNIMENGGARAYVSAA